MFGSSSEAAALTHWKLVLLLFVCSFSWMNAGAATTRLLVNEEWALLSIPANPASTASVRTVFGDDLPIAAYGQQGNWVLYAYEPQANRYNALELDSLLETGIGYWMIQNTGVDVVLDLPANSTSFATSVTAACPASGGCVSVPVRAVTGPVTWNMLGRSGNTAMRFDETRIESAGTACAQGCSPDQAASANLMHGTMYRYNGNGQPYEPIEANSILAPWDGYWAGILPGAINETVHWLQPRAELLMDDASRDAARLLTQASFGPTEQGIAEARSLGAAAWIDRQLALQGPPHLEFVQSWSNGSHPQGRHDIWWIDAMEGEDQLRQRVAFALSQILVISDQGYTLSNTQYGVTHYYDLLRDSAFGSYRQLLEDITLNPVMGTFLSMRQNSRGDVTSMTRPDENFAREVMQLFSIGLYMLNPDGSPIMSGGSAVPAYTQADVESYARVFTGWNYRGVDRWDAPFGNSYNQFDPMEQFPGFHDFGAKSLLRGATSPAGISASQDLANALDSLANHPNVGPFLGKQLIQRLVTSNPTPAYVARISTVFNNNGQGIRGDLGAVVRAILLDPEARNGHQTVAGFGKLREPLLRLTHLWRAFNVSRGTLSDHGEYVPLSPQLYNLDVALGQAVLKSASVFNFYHPDYAPVGPIQSGAMVAPEAEIYTDDNILSATQIVNTQIQRQFQQNPTINERRWASLDLAAEIGLASEPAELLDRLDMLLLSGAMSDGLRQILLDHMTHFSNDAGGRSQRVRDSLLLIMTSPEYLVQK